MSSLFWGWQFPLFPSRIPSSSNFHTVIRHHQPVDILPLRSGWGPVVVLVVLLVVLVLVVVVVVVVDVVVATSKVLIESNCVDPSLWH